MNINRVKLKGFIGIKKGLGLDEVELDISELAGLIAISGKTGAGKTTLIENMQPYAQLVSRPATALKNHVYLRDSVKELDFEHDGQFYRTIVKVDAQSGRSEGYVYAQDQSLVNGKIREYNNWVAETFGSPNLFFNSAFAAQNSKKISDLTPANLKALFTEFLGGRLSELVRYENGAKSVLDQLSTMANTMDGEIKAMEKLPEQIRALEDQIKHGSGTIANSEKALKQCRIFVATKERSVEDIRKRKADNEKLKAEKAAAEKKVQETMAAVKKATLALQDHQDTEYKRLRGFDEKLASLKETIKDESDIKAAQDKINKNYIKIDGMEKELAEARAIQAKNNREVDDLRVSIDADTDARIKLERDMNDRHRKEFMDPIREREIEIKDIEIEIKMVIEAPAIRELTERLNQATESIKLLDKRGTDLSCECGETFECNSKNCEFIQVAVKAQETMPVIESKLRELEKERESRLEFMKEKASRLRELNEAAAVADNAMLSEEKIKIQKCIDRLDKAQRRVREIQKSIHSVDGTIDKLEYGIRDRKDEIQRLKNLAGAAVKIAVIKNEIEILERQKAEVLEAGAEISKRLKDDHSASIRDHQKATNEHDAIIIETNIDSDLYDVSRRLDIAKHEERTLENYITGAKATLNSDKAHLAELEAQRGKLDWILTKKDRIIRETSRWIYIRDACGANGLRALEINNVAPSIAADANKLLEQALGAWAMVDFNTLDDQGREVLEPRVIDPDGDSVLIANRSGGQQVWALKALRLAMTLISKENSGKNYLTAYADEDDAGLDVDTAQAYTRLYKVFMPAGGFRKCLFISHKPECVGLADHIIRVNGGGLSIER